MWKRTILSAAAVICIGLPMAACGSDESPSDTPTPSSEHPDATDVADVPPTY
jgi:hypothetical protein